MTANEQENLHEILIKGTKGTWNDRVSNAERKVIKFIFRSFNRHLMCRKIQNQS